MDESDEIDNHVTENQSQEFQEDVKTNKATILLNDMLTWHVYFSGIWSKERFSWLSEQRRINQSLQEFAPAGSESKEC